MRPDAKLYRREDAARYLQPNAPPYLWSETEPPPLEGSKGFAEVSHARKYAVDQPRVPAGNPEGGQWTDGIGAGVPKVRLAFAGPAVVGARATIQLGLMLYTMMSARNGADERTVTEFRAREFAVDGSGTFDFSGVRQLDRDEVDVACPRLGEVQARTDVAAEAVKSNGGALSPQQYGTAVHLNLRDQIKDLDDPSLLAEKSLLKTKAEANYGDPGSVRVDVLENVGSGTVCVYDIKTGNSVLSGPRMSEIAVNVEKNLSWDATYRGE